MQPMPIVRSETTPASVLRTSGAATTDQHTSPATPALAPLALPAHHFPMRHAPLTTLSAEPGTSFSSSTPIDNCFGVESFSVGRYEQTRLGFSSGDNHSHSQSHEHSHGHKQQGLQRARKTVSPHRQRSAARAKLGRSGIAVGFPSVSVLNAGLDFELDLLGLAIERESRNPPPPSLPLSGPTLTNVGRGAKRRTPDFGDEDLPLSESSTSASAPEDDAEEDHRSGGSRPGGRQEAGKGQSRRVTVIYGR